MALLEEEELEHNKRKITAKDNNKFGFRSFPIVDKQKAMESDKMKMISLEDKLGTLKAYRRQIGLCFKCGEKWGPGHKCPT